MSRQPTGEATNRATVDVINFWCVAILLVSAVSVAAVVGAAVVAGEFDEVESGTERETVDVDAGVLVNDEDGEFTVTWSDPGDALYLEIRNGDATVDTLEYVGESAVVERDSFEVVAVYEDGSTVTIGAYGGS